MSWAGRGRWRASFLWGENVAAALCSDEGGFKRLKGSPQTYVQEQREIRTCVHGDDFWNSGKHEDQAWLRPGTAPAEVLTVPSADPLRPELSHVELRCRTPSCMRASCAGTIEVTIAMAIFFVCMFALLSLTTLSLNTARRLEFVEPDIGWVASELSLTNVVEEGFETGDFGDHYPGWNWTREVYMYPVLEEFGGDILSSIVSSKTKEGLDALFDTITMQAGTHVCLRTTDATSIFSAIGSQRVSHMCGAPVVANMMVHATAEEHAQLDGAPTVKMMTAGAPPRWRSGR